MHKEEYRFGFDVYGSSADLSVDDKALLDAARKVTEKAYAPYSNFQVGAVAKLKNGETISGTNQENASYPVGICAERVLLSAVSSLYPNVAIDTIAISYQDYNPYFYQHRDEHQKILQRYQNKHRIQNLHHLG